MLKLKKTLLLQFLQDYVFLQGIQVYTHVIRALSSLLDESMLTESTIM